MFRGFNLNCSSLSDGFVSQYKAHGAAVISDNASRVRETLKAMAEDRTTLDGDQIRETWFPRVEADIFLSHSHRDLDAALALAGWLKEELGLTAFVDSSVWGYAPDLLKLIDNEYCRNVDGKTYDYDKRNYSTSHVHAMLSTALAMMIDKTECLLFLSTPQSVSSEDVVKTTKSPWIYTELLIASISRERVPKRHLKKVPKVGTALTEEVRKALEFKYTIPRPGGVKDIDLQILKKWQEEASDIGYRDVPKLDILYRLAGVDLK